MANKMYVGDIGTIILIDMGEDISDSTNISLLVITPGSKIQSDGTITDMKTWIPTIHNDNFLKYIIAEGDLNQIGIYKINPKLTIGSWTGCGNMVQFTVVGKGS